MSIVSSRQSAVDSQQSTVCQEGRAKKIVLIILFQAAKFCKLNMTIKTKLNDEITELVRREVHISMARMIFYWCDLMKMDQLIIRLV